MERVDKFTEEEYEKIKSYVRENESPRNYLLVVLGYHLPLRISHLLQLKVKDVRSSKGEIRSDLYIEEWDDTISINDESNRALNFYLDQTKAEQNDWLFPSTSHDQPINRSWTWELINRWADAVGLEGEFGTDSLRKHEGISGGSSTADYYSIDVHAFDDLNSERAAYALGVFATDGNIAEETSQLRVSVTDRELAKDFRDCLKSNKDITKMTLEGQKPVYSFTTCKQEIIEGVSQYVPTQSQNWTGISTPIKESSAVNHFIRGVIDGDGYVGRGGEGYTEYNVIITGKQAVLIDLKDIIVEGCGVEHIYIRKKSESKDVYGGGEYYDLKIVGRDQVQLLYNWIYDEAKYYLTRKKKRMKNIISDDNKTSDYMDELWSE